MVCSLTLFKHSLRSSTEASAKPNFSDDPDHMVTIAFEFNFNP